MYEEEIGESQHQSKVHQARFSYVERRSFRYIIVLS